MKPFTIASLITYVALALTRVEGQIGPPIPPLGTWCCPPTGPGGRPLQEQQNGPFAIWCV
ncbi:hypothetical protein MD484_g483, partial [Candolleomyces efflorescens]